MFNNTSSLPAYLASRRSGKPRDLIAPGPDDAQLREILSAAMRTPDHGKLAPWRFIVIPQDKRAALATLLRTAYLAERPEAGRLELESMDQFANQAPTLIVVMSTPAPNSKVPIWEQELSAGAAIMNMLHAATAHGFAGGWLTAWAAFNNDVRNAFGGPEDRIAGFVFIGTLARDLEERPRPDYDTVVSTWEG